MNKNVLKKIAVLCLLLGILLAPSLEKIHWNKQQMQISLVVQTPIGHTKANWEISLNLTKFQQNYPSLPFLISDSTHLELLLQQVKNLIDEALRN